MWTAGRCWLRRLRPGAEPATTRLVAGPCAAGERAPCAADDHGPRAAGRGALQASGPAAALRAAAPPAAAAGLCTICLRMSLLFLFCDGFCAPLHPPQQACSACSLKSRGFTCLVSSRAYAIVSLPAPNLSTSAPPGGWLLPPSAPPLPASAAA
ncbi:MAG: hypothetical protein J3K34DRAFT_52430 [Monoraphidium minutum]|nr:MAG: hypothetical protein J3K34DRAFT_52430 [Monoraphidium minutum]